MSIKFYDDVVIEWQGYIEKIFKTTTGTETTTTTKTIVANKPFYRVISNPTTHSIETSTALASGTIVVIKLPEDNDVCFTHSNEIMLIVPEDGKQ